MMGWMFGVTLLLGKLANADRLQAMRQGFQRDGARFDYALWIIGAAGAIGLIALVVRIAQRAQFSTHEDLLSRAAPSAGLSRADIRDIRLIAHRARLRYPLALLLSPANLQHGVNIAAQSHPDPKLQQRVDRLSRRLFEVGLSVDKAPANRSVPGSGAQAQPA